MLHARRLIVSALILTSFALPCRAADPVPLPGTQPLTMEGDIASELVARADKFLLKEIEKAATEREKYWKRDTSSAEAYNKSIEPNRKRLAHILGVRDPRVPFDAPELVGTTDQPALVGKGEGFEVFAVRWPAFAMPTNPTIATVYGEGLLLVPTGRQPIADVVAIPHCDQTPEQIAGLVEGVPAESQFARRLAESGCRVIVPMLINRQEKHSNLTNREYLYRSAFEVGRGLVGYEVQKVLAAVDWFAKDEKRKIGVIGYGDGGMLALYAGALDTRIAATVVSGYFGNRDTIWQQPIDRNVFGLLREFGDAELAAMIAPRALTIEASTFPEITIPGGRGAPAAIITPSEKEVETTLVEGSVGKIGERTPPQSRIGGIPAGVFVPTWTVHSLLLEFAPDTLTKPRTTTPTHLRKSFDPAARHARQFNEIDQHTQLLLKHSPNVRTNFLWNKLDYSSLDAYSKSTEQFRKIFYEDVIGKFDYPLLRPNARTRKVEENEKWTRYEVVLDVFDEIFAYGLLTLPKDIKEGEKRPVVVCQHGLEGRPQSTIGAHQHDAYKAFATKLAERGFITFSPQNLYIFEDRFRTLQRKANPLGKTLFSIITPQHQQIVDWLQSQPFVDPERVAFYGLSYGGKTAMRVPALVTDYCLSICSADFNEWVDKNASTTNIRSYVNTGEYEIFEWDLGSTFNYAEMAGLIAPRPFMVERGHGDGVADDWTVAWEYSKIRNLYAARLHIADRTEIEWFDGPHTIHGVGTFEFLHKHLKWPKP